jgi:DNA-binding NarL/FixJ family response regulator
MCDSRIVILSDQLLFAEGVRQIVEPNPNVQVVSVEKYAEDTLAKIRDLKPEIVLLGDNADLPNSLVVTLLDAIPDVRVVRLTLEGNMIHVYDRHQFTAQSKQDLIRVLDNLSKRIVN